MSDLLPLLSETLRDKVIHDAHEEIKILKKRAKFAEMVQVVHTADRECELDDWMEYFKPIPVYASGSIAENGRYIRTNDWEVGLETVMVCRLADLRHCRIQVGGGYEILSFLDPEPSSFELAFNISDLDTRDSKAIFFRFAPHGNWLHAIVKGWMRWHQEREDGNIALYMDGDEAIVFLCEDVASRYPEAKVEFLSVSFPRTTIFPAMMRLIDCEQIRLARCRYEEMLGDFDDEDEDVDTIIDGLCWAVRKLAVARFNHYLDGKEGRSVEELLEILPPIVNDSGFQPLAGDPTSLSLSGQSFIDQVIVTYIDHGRAIAEERYGRTRG